MEDKKLRCKVKKLRWDFIIVIIFSIIILTNCTKPISSNEFTIAQDMTIHLVKSKMYSQCEVEKTHYDKSRKIYTIYLKLENGEAVKAFVDMTSKDEKGRFNRINIEKEEE